VTAGGRGGCGTSTWPGGWTRTASGSPP
jgi:hypothetical protein